MKEEYFGILAIQGENPLLTSEDRLIFEYFADIVIKAVKRTAHNNSRELVTIRTVFTDLLNCYPVSERKIEQVQEENAEEENIWFCAVLSPSAALETIPVDYFCMQLEISRRAMQFLLEDM